MIYTCPFCGKKVSRAIRDGITTCNNCHRVFDSSSFHKILSAAWLSRNHDINHITALQEMCELSECEAEIVEKYVINECLSHDELLKVINPKTCLDCKRT